MAAEVQSKKYDQKCFLDLAAKGKDEWNVWRRDPASKDVPVTFFGVDFSETPWDQINFEGFEFGDYADFSQCKWRGVRSLEIGGDLKKFAPGRACFAGAAFGGAASFIGAAFGDWAGFAGAAFGHSASFADAAFGGRASFDDAAFGAGASFSGAAFGHLASFADAAFGYGAGFDGVAFERWASFSGAVFGDFARFAGAAFADGASFDNTFFKGRVEFTGKSKEQWATDVASKLGMDEKAHAALKKRHEDLWKTARSGPDRFLPISFARARFDGEANFSGRTFEGAADFSQARFYYPPDFDPRTKDARADFTGAHIGFVQPGRLLHWTSDTKVPLRLRGFRKIAEETKNHDLERDLYIEERKAERGVYLHQLFEELKRAPKREWPLNAARLIAHVLWIIVMGVYWALADYGRSFVRPAAWLVSSGFLFYWCYGKVLAPLMPKACPLADKYEHAVGMVALGNAVPFVGPLTIDADIKKFLFCPNNSASCLPPIPPEGFQLLVIFQNLFSITCVFFIGLALRNYFRIK